MKVLWICALPLRVQREVFGDTDHGAQVAASWIVAHLPPPPGIDLHLACLWPGGDQRKTATYDGATVHLLPCPRRGRALLLFQRDTSYFQPLFAELRPEVVHAWGTEDSYGLVARRLAPSHHVIGIQGLITAYRKRVAMHRRDTLTALTERLTLAKANCVVAESEYSLREARALCRADTKLKVVEHPLRREFLAATAANSTGKVVLFVGLLQERKGIRDAVEAFAKAAPSDWRLQVIGAGRPTEEQSVERLAERLQLQDRFQHRRACGAEELVQTMQASSVFLLPTRIDTGPTALKEALTMGLWPVCYDNSGPGEYIRKYGFGSLAIDGDIESLTKTLRQVLQQRSWEQTSKRAALAARTRHDFSSERAWRDLLDCYAAVARGNTK